MERTIIKKILPEERETLLCYDQTDKKWYADTVILKHYNKFLKQGWIQTKMYVDEDGNPVGGWFEAPARGITIRGAQKKAVSEAQRNRFSRVSNDQDADDETDDNTDDDDE